MSNNYDPLKEALDIDCRPGRIPRLPRWILTKNAPAFYDTESVTAIEMVARLYGKMEQLIEDYNIYIDKINKAIDDFEKGIIEDQKEFKECLIKLMNDYIDTIDTKINLQDTKIDEAVEYMKDNLSQTIIELVASGDISVSLQNTYTASDESLVISLLVN